MEHEILRAKRSMNDEELPRNIRDNAKLDYLNLSRIVSDNLDMLEDCD